MIIRIKSGTSFVGVGLYYLHDKRAKGEDERLTTERVAWTHALNTMENEPEAVLAEMRRTVRNQALLKRLCGRRADGRPTEDTVMTVSLAWSPDQEPSRDEMIEAGKSFLKHMGWDEHQALFVAHDDTKHPHVHLIINRIHPETGMTLDDNWSKRRAQKWGLAYEQEHGEVLCKARESKYDHDRPRKSHMTYAQWQKWQELGRDDPEFQRAMAGGAEWDVLKQVQKQERISFWKDTSRTRKEIRRELQETVRQEFAEEWQAYTLKKERLYTDMLAEDKATRRVIRHHLKAGHFMEADEAEEKQRLNQLGVRSELRSLRQDISARQKERLEEMAVPTLEDFRNERLQLYQEVLARHRAERAAFRGDQPGGSQRTDVLTRYGAPPPPVPTLLPGEREESAPANEDRIGADYRFYSHLREQRRERELRSSRIREGGHDPQERPPRRNGIDLAAGAGLSLIGKISESLETLFDTPPPRPPTEEERKVMEQERENWPAPHPNVQEQRKQEEEAEREAKLKADYEFFERRRAERGFDRDR